MNEENTQEPSKLVDASGTPLAPEPTLDDKLAEIRQRLGLNNDGEPLAPIEEDDDQNAPVSGPSGADVDWSAYDLDPKFAHLYRLPTTKLRMSPEGPVWVAIIDDFIALRAPYDILGRRIAQMVNGPEAWRLQSAVVPAGQMSRSQCKAAGMDASLAGGAGVVTLQRKLPIILPTPTLLKSEEEDVATVPAPKEEELQAAESAALKWIGSPEGQSAPANDADVPVETPPSLLDRAEEGWPADRTRLPEGARTAANEALQAE